LDNADSFSANWLCKGGHVSVGMISAVSVTMEAYNAENSLLVPTNSQLQHKCQHLSAAIPAGHAFLAYAVW
jgi:hypothetical protein